MAEPERSLRQISEFRARGGERGEQPGARDAHPGIPLPRGTVTFLLTDIAGSTRAWESYGQAMASAVGRHYEILDAAVLAHSGVRPIEQGEGDSLVAAFERPSDAVAAALAAQRGLAAEGWPAEVPLAVRMAVHTGEAQIRDERYYAGPSIIRCARLRALGHGGQVLISGTTADLLADGLPDAASLLPMGVHRLRDLRQPLRVFQLAHPALPAEFPALKSIDALPNNLPVQLTSFIGRRGELAELAGLLGEHRLVSLVGPGGAGKTRLAAQLAAEVVEQFPDGLWWVDLSPLTHPAQVPLAVMNGIGIGDDRGLDPLDRVAGYLGTGRILLLVDNCEHVLGAAAGAVDRLLRACRGMAAVATSREPLGVGGEVAWRISPLSVPAQCLSGGDGVAPEEALAAEGIQLFVERAFDARPTFRLEQANATTVAAICARLDGLPLAIELAAVRARNLSPERILAGLDDRFRLLTGGARTAAARQQTLQASVDWSHDLLGEDEQVVLRRLAACSGGFELEAAEAVASGGPITEWDVLGLLSDLVDKSLVTFDGERYGMLATLHAFASEKLVASGEAADVRARHAAYFLARAEAATAMLDREIRPVLMDGLRREHGNLRAALEWSSRGEELDELEPRLVVALMFFWLATGHYTEGLRWHRRVLARMPADRTPIRCRVVWGLGHLSLNCAETSNGLGANELAEALALARELDDPALVARPLAAQGAIFCIGTPFDAMASLDEATALARAVGDEWGVSYALWWEAMYWIFARNRPERAQAALAELEEMGVRGGSVSCLGWNDILRGLAAWHSGRLSEAWTEYERGLARSFVCNDPMVEMGSVGCGADALLDLGEYDRAEELASRTVGRLRRTMDSCRTGFVEMNLARIALARGDLAGARRGADAVEAPIRAAMLPWFVNYLLAIQGRTALESGDLAAARVRFDEQSALAEHMNVPWDIAMAHQCQGLLARAEGSAGTAEDFIHKALAIHVEYGFRGKAAGTLEVLASLAAAGGSAAEAVRVFAAADALRTATGQVRWPLDQGRYDTDLVALRAACGETFDVLWAEGAHLSFEEAAAYASRARGERKRPSTGWASLTPTELGVVAAAATGASNAEIGARLFISPATVKTHLGRIYAKLGLTNRAALAAEATARGLPAR